MKIKEPSQAQEIKKKKNTIHKWNKTVSSRRGKRLIRHFGSENLSHWNKNKPMGYIIDKT
jgi:hypothetical protein